MDEDVRNYKPPKRTYSQIISETPCLKKSLFNGVAGGITTGLLSFLFTSNVRQATHLGMGGFFITACGMWTFCRYHFSKQRWDKKLTQAAIQEKILTEGTALEKAIQHDSKDV